MSVIGFNTAQDIWEDLTEHFGQSNGSIYIQIQRELASTTQGSSDIATYFTKLRGLWDELNTAYVGPTCTCGALPKHLEEQKLFQFLSGLNEPYSTCKSNIFMMNPLPTISKAYSMVHHDEKQKEHSIPSTLTTNSMFFHATSYRYNDSFKAPPPSVSYGFGRNNPSKINFESQGRSYPQKGVPYDSPGSSLNGRTYPQRINFESKYQSTNLQFCRYCKNPGYVMSKCYKLHGYPADYQFNRGKKSVACVQSMFAADSLNNKSSTTISPSHGSHNEPYQYFISSFDQQHLSEQPNTEFSGFSNFAGMFNSVFSSPVVNSVGFHACASSQLSVTSWILDSGETNHMTHHKYLLHNLHPIPTPFLIILPNGYKVKVISTGSLFLRSDIMLHNMVLVPPF